MNITMLEKLGSNASLQASRDLFENEVQYHKDKKWCVMFLDDGEELDVNEEAQSDAETQLH